MLVLLGGVAVVVAGAFAVAVDVAVAVAVAVADDVAPAVLLLFPILPFPLEEKISCLTNSTREMRGFDVTSAIFFPTTYI